MSEGILSAFEMTVVKLLHEKPFYGQMLLQMKRAFSDSRVPTAGVNVTSSGINLFINPTFWMSLNDNERVAVLEHEVLHLLHGHCGRGVIGKRSWNVAADVAINQFIPYIDTMEKSSNTLKPLTLKAFREGTERPDALAFQSMEYYHSLMPKSEYSSMDSHDDHSMWEQTDLTPDQIAAKVKGAIRVAKDNGGTAGLEPGVTSAILEALKSNINWKSILKSFMSSSQETLLEASRKKRNRRYGFIQPGFKKKPKLHLGVCVDTSGSMSDKMLMQVFAEINEISEFLEASITVIEADCVVQNIYKYEKNKGMTFKGRGGTAYQPALDACKKLGVDCIVYLGDMDMADIPNKPSVPILWACCTEQDPPVPWGGRVRIICEE